MWHAVLLAGIVSTTVIGASTPREASAQDTEVLSPWSAIQATRFPAQELDSFTKLQWVGLRLVKPEELADIVGFYAYPASDVCSDPKYFWDDPVLIVGDGQNTRGWDLANYATVVNTLEMNVGMTLPPEQNDNQASLHLASRAAASTLIEQTLEGRSESEVRRRVAEAMRDAIENSKIKYDPENAEGEKVWNFEIDDTADVEDPLSYFCGLYPEAENNGGTGNVYLGFSREADKSVRNRVQNPTVFWSTIGAIGQAKLD